MSNTGLLGSSVKVPDTGNRALPDAFSRSDDDRRRLELDVCDFAADPGAGPAAFGLIADGGGHAGGMASSSVVSPASTFTC